MTEQLCSNPWRKNFVECKIWDHPSKTTQECSKLGGGSFYGTNNPPLRNPSFPYEAPVTSGCATCQSYPSFFDYLRFTDPTIVFPDPSIDTQVLRSAPYAETCRFQFHPKTLIEMWIICLDPVSANSEKGRGSEWAVRVEQRLPSRFVQSRAAREMNLVQIVVEAPAIRGGLPSS